MHDVRRGRRPRRGDRRPLWVAVLLAVAVTLVGVAVLTAWLRSAPSVADARGASMTLRGPAPNAYPWSGPVPTAVDPWGFTQGQCTSYVAWWLNTHGVPFARQTRGPAGTAHFGDAASWDAAARKAGFVVTATPRVGSVAQWHAGETSPVSADPADASGASGSASARGAQLVAGEHGHVAVVVAVGRHDDVATVGYDGATHVFERLTTRAPRYLQIGALPRPVTVDPPGEQDMGRGTSGAGADGAGSAATGTRVLSCR